MKRLIIVVTFVVATLSVFAQSGRYTINGTIKAVPEAEGCTIYLFDYHTNQNTDSAVIRGGKFTFSGQIDVPSIRRVDLGRLASANLILETGVTTIDMVAPPLQANPQGTSLNNKLREYRINQYVFYDIIDSLYELIQNDTSRLNTDARQKETDALEAQYNQQCKNLIINNNDNAFGAYILWTQGQSSFSPIEFDSLMQQLSPVITEYNPVRKIAARNVKLIRTADGKPFVDFNAKKVDNVTPVKLSDYVGRGKWVLVDFWASWCAPCMAELPNIKKVRDSLGDKVVILGVNVWDKPEKCVEAIRKKEMAWENIIVPDNTATDIYAIESIPRIILFDPEGKIVDRELRGNTMDDIIKYYIKSYEK